MSRRAGRYVRQKARQRQRREFRSNWKAVVAVCSVFVITMVALVVAMGLWAGREVAFFTAGAAAVAVGFMVWFCTHSTYVQRLLAGADAERLTSGALRRLRRQGWRRVDDVAFRSGNVDHVLAGPGGAFAVETKWTSVPWRITDDHFDHQHARDAVRQSRANARLIGALLRGHYEINDELTPLLVIWGPGRPRVEAAVYVDGVLVVPGPLLRRTFSPLGDVMEVGAASDLIGALREFTRSRDRRKSTHQHLVARPVGARINSQPIATPPSAALGELRLQPAR